MKKTAIVYGEYCGTTRKAIELLTQFLLDETGEYPACHKAEGFVPREGVRYLYVGTASNNPLVGEKTDKVLTHPEEYYIRVKEDEVLIQGSDEGGMLYGCVDFYCKYLLPMSTNHDHLKPYFENLFADTLPDFSLVSHPDVKDRGIWTWGHVIFDYKGFIDNMVKCKMNTLIVWDDFPPVNAREMTDYAHLCNVKVIWGYAWLWDTDFSKITREYIDSNVDSIVALYEEKYKDLGGDGIYFQSFTELNSEYVNGLLIAEAVTDFVNLVSGRILEKYPELELQFGLHSMSVKEKLPYIQKVDKRVRITWEDCGAFPFAYRPNELEGFGEMVEFTKKITNLRSTQEQTDKFGVVLKGLTSLDWSLFEHQQGPFVLGTCSERFLDKNVRRKEKIWKYVQAYWLANADRALEVIRSLQQDKAGELCITALVEDGLFEKKMYFPVALYAEMLWNTGADLKVLMAETAQRDWVDFA